MLRVLRRPSHAVARSLARQAQSDAAFWSEEWRRLGLRARAAPEGAALDRLAFVQLGFGCDQHGRRDAGGGATKAAVRACRNAIEFNSIPGMIELVPGGQGMLVTDANKRRYVDLVCAWRLFGCIEPQVGALLQGFHAAVPPAILSQLSFVPGGGILWYFGFPASFASPRSSR